MKFSTLHIIFICFFIKVICSCAFADDLGVNISTKLADPEAAKLAALANDGSTKLWKNYDYQPQIKSAFLIYEGLNDNGSTFGWFAVNPWTGDVWNLFACKKDSTTAFRSARAKIRRRFTIEEIKQYKALSQIDPGCWQ